MARPKSLGGPEDGIALGGTVAEISMNDLDTDGTVVVRHGPKPKKDKEGMLTNWPKTTRVEVPSKLLSSLALGDKVEVRVIPTKSGGGQVRV